MKNFIGFRRTRPSIRDKIQVISKQDKLDMLKICVTYKEIHRIPMRMPGQRASKRILSVARTTHKKLRMFGLI